MNIFKLNDTIKIKSIVPQYPSHIFSNINVLPLFTIIFVMS